jgi:hypothetical protein
MRSRKVINGGLMLSFKVPSGFKQKFGENRNVNSTCIDCFISDSNPEELKDETLWLY